MLWNAYGELAGRRLGDRYLRIRYEDFAAQPRQTLAEIVRFAAGDAASLPFTADFEAELRMSHTVSGNPGRFDTGRTSIRLDDAWGSELAWPERSAIALGCLPGLVRYGYLSV